MMPWMTRLSAYFTLLVSLAAGWAIGSAEAWSPWQQVVTGWGSAAFGVGLWLLNWAAGYREGMNDR